MDKPTRISAGDAFEKYEKETYGENTPLADVHIECFYAGYNAGVKDMLFFQAPVIKEKETPVQYDSLEIRKAYAGIKAEAMSRIELEQLAYERIFVNTKYTHNSIMIDEIRNKNPNALQYCKKEGHNV